MLNGIGDIVCVSPTLQALKQRYPGAKLTVIVRPHLRELLDSSPSVDEVIPYETGRHWKRPLFMWKLNRRRFDLWVDLHVPTFNTVSSNRRDFTRNAWIMRAAAARFRRAYAVPELAPWLSHPLALPTAAALGSTNIVDTTLELADATADHSFCKYIPVAADDHAWAANELPDREGPRVALFFGSRQAADLWPDARILEFIALLDAALPDAELVLIGGEHERALTALLAERTDGSRRRAPRDFICRASLPRTAALLARCDTIVATDSGPMHVADAMRIPIVALFSSKNHPAIWRPIEPRSLLINHAVACGPCFRATCPVSNKCMDMITPGEVLAALEQLLPTVGATTRIPATNDGLATPA